MMYDPDRGIKIFVSVFLFALIVGALLLGIIEVEVQYHRPSGWRIEALIGFGPFLLAVAVVIIDEMIQAGRRRSGPPF
ncbi:MAG: hypothetical protein ACRD88_04320 [Terriglobia bacterium]